MPDLQDRLAAALAPRYTVDRELAAGGMGTVFLGHDTTLGREVAIKVLPPERATAVGVERFKREAHLLAQLAHPNIVPIFEAQYTNDLLWFVMPHVRGETLAQRLAAGPLPPEHVRRIGVDLLAALEYAHTQDVVHRDVKPSNIFLEGDRALLADFGIARTESTLADTLTGTDQVVGTLRYMSPEQRAGCDATARSDIYAVGVTLREAATGKRWEPADSLSSRAWRALPSSLTRAIRGAVRTDPADRWPDAATFRRELAGASRWSWHSIALVAAAAAITLIAVASTRNPFGSPRPMLRRAALIILPFKGTSNSLGVQLARYASQLIEFSPIRVIPGTRVERITLDSALSVAEHVVTGSFVAHDGKVDALEAQVLDSAGTAVHLLRVPGDPADPASWGRDVADALVERLFPTELTEFRQLTGTEPNKRALDAYREGQLLFQNGRWHESEAKFTEAEQADSNMLRATWQKLIARQWQSLPFMGELALLATRADRMREPFPRLLRAQLEPDLDRRLALYDSLVREYPNYAMVRQMAANELFSRGPLVGRPLQLGIEAFQQSARDIPDLDQPNTYTQTVWGAVRLGEERLAREQLRLRRAPPGDPWANILWLAVNGRFQRWVAVPMRQWMLFRADSSDIAALHRAVRMGLDVDDPWDQDAIGRFLERHAASNQERENALAAQSTALLLVGRPLAALRQLDEGASYARAGDGYRLQRGEWRVLLPLLPEAPIALPSSVRDSGRALLRAVPPGDSLWPRAAWALTVDAIARHRDRERDSLQSLLHSRVNSPWIQDLATYTDAIALGAMGKFDSALALSRRIHQMPNDAEVGLRGPLVRAVVYLHRGSWRRSVGDSTGAETEWLWHENNDIAGRAQGEPEQGEMDAALSGVARLLRAENLPALDRRAEGCALLSRVATLWRDAEPSMQSLQSRVAAERAKCR